MFGGADLIDTIKMLWCFLPKNLKHKYMSLLIIVFFFVLYEIFTIYIIAQFISVLLGQDTSGMSQKYLGFHIEISPISFAVLCVCALGLKNIFQGFLIFYSRFLAARASGCISESLLKHLISLPYIWHRDKGSADLILALEWRMHLGNMIDYLIRIYRELLVVIFILILMVIMELWGGVLFFSVVTLFGYFSHKIITLKFNFYANKCKSLNESMYGLSSTVFQGIKEIKVFDVGGYFTNIYSNDAKIFADKIAARELLARLTMLSMEVFGFICLVSYYFAGAYYQNGNNYLGEMALVTVAIIRMLPSMIIIAHSFSSIKVAFPFVSSLFSYLKIESKETHGLLKEKTLCFNQKITFEDVSFKYDNGKKFYLQHINMTIQKGDMIGVIGGSGSGKTTLADLIIGLLEATSGHIAVDGIVLNHNTIKSWQQKVGYVSQHPYLIEGTLAENIAFAVDADSVDENWVLECCKMASMEDILEDAPEGIHTKVGERGGLFSGGQIQRISIARALYRRPEVLILDEATSALDKNNEEKWQNCLNQLKGQITMMIISHRLHTIECCDTVISMKAGEIISEGIPELVINLSNEKDGLIV